MFAQTLATLAILTSGYAAGAEVGVYLRSQGSIAPPAMTAMRAEVDGLLAEAGYHLVWWMGSNPGHIEADEVVVLDLEGDCTSAATETNSGHELGSTPVVDHNVLPFTQVNCNVINRMIHPALRAAKRVDRDLLYGRALARVVAHELYHALAHTQRHSETGIAKPRYSADDLLMKRFDFDSAALSVLRKEQHPAAVVSESGTSAVAEFGDSGRQ